MASDAADRFEQDDAAPPYGYVPPSWMAGQARLPGLHERLSLQHGRQSGVRVTNIMASIKVRVSEDGTCSICRNGTIISTGLTRHQADQLVAVLRAIEGHD